MIRQYNDCLYLKGMTAQTQPKGLTQPFNLFNQYRLPIFGHHRKEIPRTLFIKSTIFQIIHLIFRISQNVSKRITPRRMGKAKRAHQLIFNSMILLQTSSLLNCLHGVETIGSIDEHSRLMGTQGFAHPTLFNCAGSICAMFWFDVSKDCASTACAISL